MATQRPRFQNGHVHFHLDKPVESLKPDAVQNENLHILKGKGVSGVKGVKPEKAGLKKRTALADLSKAGKPQPPKIVNNLKDKSVLRSAQAPPKKASSGKAPSPFAGILTDEEIRKCQEWAKEGIESASYTGTDMLNHEKEMQEKRIRDEVEMVTSNVQRWAAMTYDSFFPIKRHGPIDDDDVIEMKVDPEIFLPLPGPSFPVFEEDMLLETDISPFSSFLDYDSFEFKLKESDDNMA